jgi:hypothetical protein
MKMISAFKEHPASVGETYPQHFRSATGFALRLLLAGGACMIHAVLPCFFERTGSRMVAALHQRMITARHRQAGPNAAQHGAATPRAR